MLISDCHLSKNINLSYNGPRNDLLDLVPLECKKILDIGCNEGALGASLKMRQAAWVAGAEIDPIAAGIAAERLDDIFVGDLEGLEFRDRFRNCGFDGVICGDVLEHLQDPWGLLDFLVREVATQNAVFVVSLPNVGHWSTIYSVFLLGHWPLNSRGIHDRTHLRWFTVRDTLSLVKNSGLHLEIVRKKPRLFETIHPWNGGWSERILFRLLGNLLVHQVLVQGRKL